MLSAIKYRLIYVILLICTGTSAVLYYCIQQHQKELLQLQKSLQAHSKAARIATEASVPYERVVCTKDGMTWPDIQKRIKDTVVQVFSHQLEKNLREPYRAPEQSRGVGSGFFINEQGDLLTNYHVVAQASDVYIQIPFCGQEQFEMSIRGVSPERDIALLSPTEESYNRIIKRMGKIPYLLLGDSDAVLRSQEVLALGFPLGQFRLKSTLGIVAGRERLGTFGYFQITAPLNPGNSGGPAINTLGQVIGINSRGIMEAQNIGYIIPINEVKNALSDLYEVKLLRKPILGCIFTVATDELINYLGNPDDGGWYIPRVFEGTLFHDVGIKNEDMLYEFNGYRIDKYGELNVPWSEDKISLFELLNRVTIGDDISLVIYRKGVKKEFDFKLTQNYLPPVRQIYPEFEPEALDYENIGGAIVMNTSLNHIAQLVQRSPDLVRYGKAEHQHIPSVLVTHIVPNSPADKARILQAGDIISSVNDQKIQTLHEFRDAVMKTPQAEYIRLKVENELTAVLSVEKIIKEEKLFSDRYFIPPSPLIQELKARRGYEQGQKQ